MKDDKVKQLELFKDVEEQVREIRVMIDKEGRMLKRQLKPIPSISQRIIQWILNVFGIIYVLIERNVEYPDDDIILDK